MSGTERDSREVRGLLPQSPGSQDVRVGSFDYGRSAAQSRTDCAWKHPNPSQILRASIGTPPRFEPLLANRHSPFRRQAAVQRRTPAEWHTSPKHTITSVFSWRTNAQPRTPQWHPEPGVLRLWRSDEAQDDRMRPPNSSSQCFQKLQCFWLHSMDCRFGQYIPVPMAFCAIGYRTRVARMSGSSTV